MTPSAIAVALAALGLVGAAPASHAGSAGVTVSLPQGWHSAALAVPTGVHANDPVTRIVVASAPIRVGGSGCDIAAYAFASTAVAVVVVEWTRLSKSARWAPRPSRFTATTLPVQAPPAIECFAGAGGSVEFADHGRHFGAYLLLGTRASPALADRARGVLDTLTVAAAPPYIMVTGPKLAKPVLLSNWEENLRLLTAIEASPRAKPGDLRTLTTRPRLDLALFWGWPLDSPPPTKASDASAHGSLYPTYRGRPALIRMTTNGVSTTRVASPRVLQIFAKHGVPTRM
ncbi:MAG: hypothetical protein ACXVZ2_05865 [Gaiellaceae bacterium]